MRRTSRRAAALLTALAAATVTMTLLAPPAGAGPDDPLPRLPEHGYARVDRIAAALARGPVFVDPDLPTALHGTDLAQVRLAARDAATELDAPVWVVVVPNPVESESQGRNTLLARLLHERTGKDGLYVVADDRGWIDTVAFDVRRRFSAADDEFARPPETDRLAGLGGRIIDRIERVRALPVTDAPRDDNLYGRLDAFGDEDRPLRDVEPERTGPFLMGLLLIGPLAGAGLYTCVRLVLRRRRGGRRPSGGDAPEQRRAPARPSLRRLRRVAGDELAALRTALVDAADGDAERGKRATAAFDAAQILFDDAGSDPGRAHDLVVVIVLAREGLAALGRDGAPSPPCFVNPLHGPADGRRRLRFDGERRRRRVCPTCVDARPERLEALTLRIPRPGGRVPHHALGGPWIDAEYGARSPLARQVLTHLEVES
ncbi:hypothetical protein [Actinomadura algeriensis]|uniref:TPM domain-containing protein n=1 Tax=Actinomadura algeriensis TaxID=1679523 RepID=A0ABR9K1L7_9ACTN|nr:hypothetical protein [Actinomadura algeriensis]MBE1536493.1 hypothetical protein [Actinomadura algeriensis]